MSWALKEKQVDEGGCQLKLHVLASDVNSRSQICFTACRNDRKRIVYISYQQLVEKNQLTSQALISHRQLLQLVTPPPYFWVLFPCDNCFISTNLEIHSQVNSQSNSKPINEVHIYWAHRFDEVLMETLTFAWHCFLLLKVVNYKLGSLSLDLLKVLLCWTGCNQHIFWIPKV